MGKTVIRASDGPGFLVNRCNRPFGLEALRLLGEQVAGIETIDRIVRLGGGFRMGPFELSDLVGVDTGFDVAALLLRALLRRAPLAALPDPGPARGRRAARAQDRARLLRLLRRLPPRPPTPSRLRARRGRPW